MKKKTPTDIIIIKQWHEMFTECGQNMSASMAIHKRRRIWETRNFKGDYLRKCL